MKRSSPWMSATARTLAVAAGCCAASAAAQALDIRWDAAGSFERSIPLKPGKFTELCAKLAKGQTVAWSFSSDTPLEFNIHYHEGKDIVFPEKRHKMTELEGELEVALDQVHCWMWENKGADATTVQVKLQRR